MNKYSEEEAHQNEQYWEIGDGPKRKVYIFPSSTMLNDEKTDFDSHMNSECSAPVPDST